MYRTALASTHTRRQLVAGHFNQKLPQPTPVESSDPVSLQLQNLTLKQWNSFCGQILYTLVHRFDNLSQKQSTTELFDYLQKVFRLSQDDFIKLVEEAKGRSAPKCLVKVDVHSARDLEAKDVDGYSDPFCMLGIINSTHIESKKPLFSSRGDKESTLRKKAKEKKFRRSLSTDISRSSSLAANDLYGGKILMTTIQYDTLNPTWNESFEFEVDSIENQFLHIDVWDYDDDISILDVAKQVTKIKGVAGINRYFKEIAQMISLESGASSDDFLGCIDIPLSKVPAFGTEGWYDLEARSKKSNVKGQCHLHIQFIMSKDTIPGNYSPKEFYTAIYTKIASYEAEQYCDKYGLIWNCQLSELAKGVLSEVAMHYDIPVRQQAICSILCQCYINDVKPLDYKVLGNELKKVITSLDDFSPDMHEELVIGLEAFVDRSMIFFNHVRDLMPENDTQNLSALPELIGILKLIYSMKKFQERRKKPNLKIDIQNACKKGTESWYYTQRELIVAKAKTLTKEFQLFRELVQKMYVDLKVSKLFYNKVFSRICDDYFTDCFLIIDKVISEDAKRLFARFDKSEFVTSEKIDQLVSDLYFTLKGLAIYRAHLSESAKSIPLQLDSIHLWSRCLLEVLIRNDFRDTKERITKAVQLEEVVDSNFKFSSSAVDTAGLFNKTCQLWKNIAWPEPDEAFAFVSKIVDNIANAGCFYGNLLDNRLKVAKFYDDVGSFDITEQLCITLNNLDHIRRNLQSLPKDLNFDQAIENLSYHGRDQQDRFRTVLTNILKGADDDLMNKTVIMIDQVGKKMEVDIYKHLQTFSSSPPTVNVNQAISPLLSYLQENSIKLQECLFKDVYHSFNIKIVDVTMKCLYQITLKVGEQKTSLFSFKSDTKSMTMMEVYNRLWDCQQVLKDFFFNGGDGIDLVTIENDHFYVQTVQFLNVAKLDTTRLIGLYFEEKLKAKQEENLGSLAVKLFYDISQHKLSVNVIYAKNLLALDSNGLSDPYVVIDLLPENLFSCSHKETKVCKKTLNPVFEETFTFIIDKALFQTSGTAVLFTVMDQDMISRNDYGGESVILMKDITIIDDRKDANQEEIPELNLKLSMPCISGEIFNLIDDRVDDDPNAKKFIAFRRKACDAAEDARNK